MPGELVPEDWLGRRVNIRLNVAENQQIRAKLMRAYEAGFIAEVSQKDQVRQVFFTWPSVISLRLLEDES
jgi:hypothetical protein